MKLPWKSGGITVKNAMWSTEINYGDGNGDGHGEEWSKIVKDGKRKETPKKAAKKSAAKKPATRFLLLFPIASGIVHFYV